MKRSRFALLALGLGAAGLAAALQAQQGRQAAPTRVIVYKTPT
jgi:succinate dehydrogenase/fumarate reductase flavoprotein subunit